MCKILCVAFLLSVLLTLGAECGMPTIRHSENGPIEGLEQISSLGQKYYAFRGIPFAEPPITGIDPYSGKHVDRRFKATHPLKRRWTKPFKAHNFGKRCIQIETQLHLTDVSKLSEDCLFLNIYVPADESQQKTVLVWIHGGGYINGDATDTLYGPDFLLSQDNIIVMVQYRLGIFGFLNLDYGEYTGNMGLKDQQLALKWVYENIENFSGNKSEILLFGKSSGAASVHFHMLNDSSRKYFNRVYASSSSAFSAYALHRENHLQKAHECFQINEMDKLIKYLKTTNSSTLVKCYPSPPPAWVPTIENSRAVGAFLTQTSDEIYGSNKVSPLDTMFSFNSQESIQSHPELLEITEPIIKDDWRETNISLPFEGFTKEAYPEEYRQAIEKLREAYFQDASTVDEIRRRNIDLMSDIQFVDSILKAVAFQANANNRNIRHSKRKNTFLFRFSVHAALNLFEILTKRKYGQDAAAHSDDDCYLFHCRILDKFNAYDIHLKLKDVNYDIIMRSVKMITNFARTGNPSIEGDTPFKPTKSLNEFFCQNVSNKLQTNVLSDITKQRHYSTWREIEEIYKSLNVLL